MRIGILASGDVTVRAAHSLSAHPGVDEVVVIGPARSKNFRVVRSASGCDLLVGAGSKAPALARRHGIPLVWDGDSPENGVIVGGACPSGLTLALADDESDLRLLALAHPDLEVQPSRSLRFPEPIGVLGAMDTTYADRPMALAKSEVFAASYVVGRTRTVTVVDDARFMSGVALAAGVGPARQGEPRNVWDDAYDYLLAATSMGLVIGETTTTPS